MNDITIRDLIFTDEFLSFYNNTDDRVRDKIDYITRIIETQRVINEKFVKKLENTDFYEMRISVSSNEYRTILFSINAENIIEATEIIVLNTFLKKDKKDYKKAIKEAINILNKTFGEDGDN